MALVTVSYRSLTGADTSLLKQWIESDPEHKADLDLFTVEQPGRSQFVLEADGEPAVYVTVENVARVYMHFNPKGSKLTKVKALLAGFKWLCENAKARGYWEVIMESRHARMVKFCRKALGFLPCTTDYSVRF